MTSERSLWDTVRRNLAPFGKLVRIESPLVAGVPDVLYTLLGATGWLELKELDAWPVRPTTTLRIPSLTLDQVLFLEGWVEAGGTAHLMLQVGRDYLLLRPYTVRGIYERSWVKDDLLRLAVVLGHHHLPTQVLLRTLSGKDSGSQSAG